MKQTLLAKISSGFAAPYNLWDTVAATYSNSIANVSSVQVHEVEHGRKKALSLLTAEHRDRFVPGGQVRFMAYSEAPSTGIYHCANQTSNADNSLVGFYFNEELGESQMMVLRSTTLISDISNLEVGALHLTSQNGQYALQDYLIRNDDSALADHLLKTSLFLYEIPYGHSTRTVQQQPALAKAIEHHKKLLEAYLSDPEEIRWYEYICGEAIDPCNRSNGDTIGEMLLLFHNAISAYINAREFGIALGLTLKKFEYIFEKIRTSFPKGNPYQLIKKVEVEEALSWAQKIGDTYAQVRLNSLLENF